MIPCTSISYTCILPGTAFEYFSGTDLDSSSGVQSGALLVDVFGAGRDKEATKRVIVEIAPFLLRVGVEKDEIGAS